MSACKLFAANSQTSAKLSHHIPGGQMQRWGRFVRLRTHLISHTAPVVNLSTLYHGQSAAFDRRRRLTQFPPAEIAKSVSTATLQINPACLPKFSAPLVMQIKSAFGHSMDSFIVLTALFKM